MRKNHSWISELALVTVVSSLVLLMFPLGGMASPGDWVIYHNEEYVPKGGNCSQIASDGVNHIEGSFEWGSSGVDFQWTYGGWSSQYWFAPDPEPTHLNGHYYFDFWTDWDYPYSGLFIILPSLSPSYAYYCTTVIT